MKFIKYTKKGKIEKYVSERAVITFLKSRNKISVFKTRHDGKNEYVRYLLNSGYQRAEKVKAGA